MDAAPPPASAALGVTRVDLLAGALLVAAALLLLGRGLAHPSIHNWDESAHQAVTRGTFATPLRPHLFEHALWPEPPGEWMSASTFLHKPTGPFWFGALMMYLVGITPLALRLGSLLGDIAAALSIYALARQAAGRPMAFLAGLAFLALPFGYELTQGYLFGDATDCTLAGWVATAMALLVVAVERQDPRWALAAGFATGLGYLCKTALALAPAGVAVLFAGLAWRKWGAGLSGKSLGLFFAALLITAVPWNAYCAYAFPDLYRYESHVTYAHLFTKEFAQWVRPPDAIFNEINESELRPLPLAVPLLALLWGVGRAVRRREPAVVAAALWVGASWVVLSIALVKVPATAWEAVPGALVLIAILLGDASHVPALAGATLGAIGAPWVVAAEPILERVPKWLPLYFPETRTHPALLIGLLLAALGALVAAGIQRGASKLAGSDHVARAGRVAHFVALAAAFVGLYPFERAHAAIVAHDSADAPTAPMRELGLAIDHVLPPGDALIFSYLDRDPPCCFLLQDLTFWSGKTNYRRAPDVAKAHQAGLHPYLVSPDPEPFAAVAGIPPFAAGRLYDLDQPAELGPPPADATPIDASGRGWHALAWSSGYRDADHDVWSLYLQSPDGLFSVPFGFETDKGRRVVTATATNTYSDPKHWVDKPWVELTVVGPHRAEVEHLDIGGVRAF